MYIYRYIFGVLHSARNAVKPSEPSSAIIEYDIAGPYVEFTRGGFN